MQHHPWRGLGLHRIQRHAGALAALGGRCRALHRLARAGAAGRVVTIASPAQVGEVRHLLSKAGVTATWTGLPVTGHERTGRVERRQPHRERGRGSSARNKETRNRR
ncbi:MAG: hypothetical protein EBX99_13810 [Acidimicrobiia bacterium]|nr:hypothetical protein [Acidimicrobiia bacterium]